MEYTRRIGFLVGPYIQLALANSYIDKINEMLNLDKGMIEIKKKFSYKKDVSSKVLILYAIEDETNEIDSKMIKFT